MPPSAIRSVTRSKSVFKNDDIQINTVFKGTPTEFEKFKFHINRLRQYSDMKLGLIHGSDIEESLNYVQCASAALLSKPEQNKILIDIVIEAWRGTKAEDLIEGTVGAKLMGCLLPKDSCPCDLMCAGAIIQRSVAEQCKDTVIVGRLEDGRLQFHIANVAAKSSLPNNSAILILSTKFTGLTKTEKNELRARGFTKITIVDPGSDVNNPVEYLNLDEIPDRTSKDISSSNTSNIILWIFLILVLIVLVYLIVKHR